jgi:hypothetical protein
LNCALFWCISRRGNLANNRGAIVELPGRAGEVSADLPTRLIEKVCFEYPVEAAVLRFTGVNLDAVCRSLEQKCGALRRSYFRLVSMNGKVATLIKIAVPKINTTFLVGVSDCRRMALSGPFNRSERAEKVYNPSDPVR